MPDVTKDAAYQSSIASFVQYFTALEENKAVIDKLKEQLQELTNKEDVEDTNVVREQQKVEEVKKTNISGDESDVPKEDHSDEEAVNNDTKIKDKKSLLNHGVGYGTLYKT